MCGIYGYFHLDKAAAADGRWLNVMGESLRHRGPDDCGSEVRGPMAMGHRRLSIIDLSSDGRQPMTNEDASIWLSFNGEIYNYKDHVEGLRARGHRFRSATDCEVILHLYEEEGIACLDKLNGMFAFALWDRRSHEVFLVRDRMGIKPLHYTQAAGEVVFGSEVKALLRHPSVSKAMDLSSLHQYLNFEYVPAPRTIYRNVSKVLPGHYIHIKNEKMHSVCYWSTRDILPESPERREEDYAEELRELLTLSVKRRLIADVPLGAFLSGGVDSSSVCAVMQELNPGSVKTFHINFEESSYDESGFANPVAKRLGTEHFVQTLSIRKLLDLVPRIMDYLDEPFGDASFFPTLLLSRFTREHVKVALSGDGPDELFAGYPTYKAHHWARYYAYFPRPLQKLVEAGVNRLPVSHQYISTDFKLKKFVSAASVTSPARRNALWLGAFDGDEVRRLLSPDAAAAIAGEDPYTLPEAVYGECLREGELNRLLYCDQRLYMQDDILTKVDRASMAASLEVRVPFLDYEIVAFAARLPEHLKMKNLITKYIVKKAMEPRLSRKTLYRSKQGFAVPMAQWFCYELRPLLEDVFAADALKQQGLFEPSAVRTLLNEHFSRRADHRKKIYTLLNFMLWHQRYQTPPV